MRFLHVILVASVASLASADTLSADRIPVHSLIAGRKLVGGRSLRIDGKHGKGGQVPTGGSPARETIDESVKKKLGMGGLSDDAFKAHKDYPFFRSMDDTAKIAVWKHVGISPHEAWKKAELEGIQSDMQLNKVIFTKEFADYTAFINTIDNAGIEQWRATGQAPVVSANSTPMELGARVMIMTATERDAWYSKAVLGLDGLKGLELTSKPNYKIYEKYYLRPTR
ncbi:hypothetical protein ON010_g11064 [Phytophthora cinnamomi]|nr:hypothetical protein ON010_g11064 [Phytophthora cinnamomi]